MVKKKQFKLSTFGSRVTSVISVALLLLVVGLIALVGIASSQVRSTVLSGFGFTIELSDDADAKSVERMKGILTDAPYVKSFVYTSPDDILKQMAQEMGDDPMDLLDENPFTGEFEVTVEPPYANADSIEALRPRFEADKDVGYFVAAGTSQQNVGSVLTQVQWILVAIGAFLLVISIVLINNTVSLSVYSRRFIIHTMQLVGATAAFVRKPFVRAGVINGVIAGIVADAIMFVLVAYSVSSNAAVAALLPWSLLWWVPLALIAMGALVCGIAARFAAQRYLNRDYDSLFMK